MDSAPLSPEGMTSADWLADMRRIMQETQADGYYLLHNHPSGDPSPSATDKSSTRKIARQLPGLRAHVIINSNKYAQVKMDATGRARATVAKLNAGEDRLHAAAIPHEVLGRPIQKGGDLVALGKELQKPGWITVIGTSSKGAVRVVVDYPASTAKKDVRALMAMARRVQRQSGSVELFLVGDKAALDNPTVKRAMSGGIVTAAVDMDGNHVGVHSAKRRRNRMPQANARYVAEGRSDYDRADLQAEHAAAARAYGGEAAYEAAKEAGRTKLNYRQWVQVRTPAFKKWFGDWEALRAQERLDRMEPVNINVPDEWRGLPVDELRAKVTEALEELRKSKTPLRHPELGNVSVVRRGTNKALHTSADPAKLFVLGDLRSAFEKSIYRGSTIETKARQIDGHEMTLARVVVDGHDMVALFNVRRTGNDKAFHNVVTLDGVEVTPAAYLRGQSAVANTGVADFIRQPFARVNPGTVSKVVDPDTGEPMVVYRSDWTDYDKFDRRKARRGFFFHSNEAATKNYGGTARAFFLAVTNPLIVPNAIPNEKNASDIKNTNHDGVVNKLGSWREIIATRPAQIKSATDNSGAFDPDDAIIMNEEVRRFDHGDNPGPAIASKLIDKDGLTRDVELIHLSTLRQAAIA